MKDERIILNRFREVYPFLDEIPDEIYFQLSTKELHLPSCDTVSYVTQVALLLNHHVMTYQRDVFDLSVPPGRHLCARIERALLTPSQYLQLRHFEEKSLEKKISLVVYKKPMMLVTVEQTSLYRYYKQRNLV